MSCPSAMLGHMSFAQKERERLGRLFLEVGPDAPTLCEGWVTRDLACHLYIRESKPLPAAGNFIRPLKSTLDKEMDVQRDRPYPDVVRAWAAGPPRFIAPFDALMNTSEHFVHHEDVRRGDGVARPREFSAATNEALLTLAKRVGAMTMRATPTPVVLTPPTLPPVTVGGKREVARRGDDIIRAKGEPGELLLWVSGRRAVDVELEGDAEKISKLDIEL